MKSYCFDKVELDRKPEQILSSYSCGIKAGAEATEFFRALFHQVEQIFVATVRLDKLPYKIVRQLEDHFGVIRHVLDQKIAPEQWEHYVQNNLHLLQEDYPLFDDPHDVYWPGGSGQEMYNALSFELHSVIDFWTSCCMVALGDGNMVWSENGNINNARARYR